MALSGWDTSQVWLGSSEQSNTTRSRQANADEIVPRFKSFILSFKENNSYIYRQQLIQQSNLGNFFLEINLDHLTAFDEELADQLKKQPEELLTMFEEGARQIAEEKMISRRDGQREGAQTNIPPIQIQLISSATPIPIRSLTGEHISRLVQIPGIVISASRPESRATELTIICRNCKTVKKLKCKGGFTSVQLPRVCDKGSVEDANGGQRTCPKDPYVVLGDHSQFVDQQTLKLQESPETVPTGEMPRHVTLVCDRYLVGNMVPGCRITVIGIYTVFQRRGARRKGAGVGAVAIRYPYVKVVGLRIDTQGSGRSIMIHGPEEEEEFLRLARTPDLYDKIWRSIAPAIYGHNDIKKAIACLLFGGSRKILPDGMKLRGDINVLLLGDPGTAKSQFLKFVEKVAPVGVYTSGKGSSAAGLTASVIREPGSRQFYLEGGAMVLADGGVVCIDEFDKMHLHDRVAIHEAMEQQTISIAKAGITTILNSRTSVLAAANPVFGSYDDGRTPFENVEFQSTILSRFDMIFLVKDIKNTSRDKDIARHVINVHVSSNHYKESASMNDDEFDLQTLKRYIAFCRQRCAPRLSDDAVTVLNNHYVSLRSNLRSNNRSAIPITVRQLEAIVRISEALAKMTLSPFATREHVNEAIRLFNVSTVEAAAAGSAAPENLSRAMWNEVETVEKLLQRFLPIGATISVSRIKENLEKRHLSMQAITRAIENMSARGDLEWLSRRKMVKRKR